MNSGQNAAALRNSMMNKQLGYLGISGLAVAAGAVAVLLVMMKKTQPLKIDEALSPTGVPAREGQSSSPAIRIEAPVFLQKDPSWGAKPLGPSGDSIASHGCTLCSMAMALGSQGFAIAPDDLNDRLEENGGFTESSLLIWGAIERVTGGKFTVEIHNGPSHDLIDRELAQGNPVIAKVLYDNRIYHWVLVTGKDSSGYLIADPLGNGDAHQPMTNYPSGIYAVRFLRAKG
ncbi:C39 family peptidase [Roseibacillus persicicus]|uniref:C39 family peptidase n=1 Tax=Roseibacillus persicicus TaxID=454148 RepID=UPI0028120616|nr:C39 family peptidase [Roseibacillus persicicus]